MRNALNLLFALGMLIFVSCKKDKPEPPPQPAVFVYTDFQPDTLLRSIDSLVWWGTYYIPAPSTSNDTLRLDVDNDGDYEVALTIGTYYQFESSTYPEYNNHVVGKFMALDNTCSVLIAPATVPGLALCNYGQQIDIDTATWFSTSSYIHNTYPYYTFTGDKYFVFRQSHPQYGLRYGWIHVYKPDNYNVYVTEMGLRCNYNLETIVVGEH